MTDTPTAPRTQRVPPEQRETRVVSARMSAAHRLATLWRSRELVLHLSRTDIKVKYKNSALGLLWSMVNPLMQLGIFFFVFQVVLKNGIPNFVIYLFSGLLVWYFFQGAIVTSTGIIVERAGIVKKVSFPREILALSTVGAQVVYFAMQLIPMAIFLIALRADPDWSMAGLVVLAMVALLVLTCALSVLLSAINVRARDMRHLIEVAMQAWFWFTPIVYSYEEKLAPALHTYHLTWLYLINPMTPITMTFQRFFYPHESIRLTTAPHPVVAFLPRWSQLTFAAYDGAVLIVALLALYGAVAVFGRLEGNFAEEL